MDSIQIQNINVFIDLLQKFGSFLRAIKINFDGISEHDGTQLLNLMNEKCSKTLQYLTLQECKGSVLNELKTPFKVTTFTLKTSKTGELQFSKNALKLNQLFPHVRILYLFNLKGLEWKFIGEFDLKELHLFLPKSKNKFINESHIEPFFKPHANINFVRVIFMTLNILQKLSECSPKIDKLALDSFSENYLNVELTKSDLIRFNVRELAIFSSHPSDKMHENVIFSQLEAFVMYLGYDLNENWMKFIDKQVNKRLNKINIKARNVDREYFLAIANKFPEMKSVNFQTLSIFVASDIVQFSERIKNLQEFHILCNITENETILLHKKLSKIDWILVAYINKAEGRADITIKR